VSRTLRRYLRRGAESVGLIGPYYRWWERRAARQPATLLDDGAPMPPPELIIRVNGTPDQGWFSERGKADLANLTALAGEEGMALDGRITVLDWGCGCGRIARWLAPIVCDHGGRYVGCDILPELAGWCGAALPGRYFANRLDPPLDLPAGEIDLVYSHSVLTHLREASVRAWLAELRRVLRPGGLAVLTFHDEVYAERWAPALVAARLKKQPYVVWNDALEGSNYLSAWTTGAHLSELASEAFEVRRICPGRTDVAEQAIIVLAAR
jgi:SAM-dependent methyltransferase